MKPNNVQRSIGSGQAGQRAAGDAPSLGKLARAHPVGPPDPDRRRRTDQSLGRSQERPPQVNPKTQRVLLAWSLLLVGLTALVIGGFLLRWFFLRMPAEEVKPVAQTQIKVVPQLQVPQELAVPTEVEAISLIKKALAVRDVAQVGDFFRLGSATPQVVVDFLAAETFATALAAETINLRWLGNTFINGISVEGVMVTLPGPGKPRLRMAIIVPDAAGKWQIDFDALAETSSPPWHKLLDNNTGTALVRVFALPDTYYNGPFRDEGQWLCYSIIKPDLETKLLGYARIGSPQAAAMAAIDAQPGKIFRVTLEIRRVAEAESKQVEISRVIAEDWATGPTAFDEMPR